MNGGRGEVRVIRTDTDLRPLLFTAGVIYVTKARAIIECTITNTRHAIGDYYRAKACAILERIRTNTLHAVGDYY